MRIEELRNDRAYRREVCPRENGDTYIGRNKCAGDVVGPAKSEKEEIMKFKHSVLAFALAVSPLALGGYAAAQDTPQPQQPAPETQGTETQQMPGSDSQTVTGQKDDRCSKPNPPADCPKDPDAATTGAISSSSAVEVTAEQQTQLRSVIKESNIQPVDKVDFDISVGVAVPQSITLHALPPRIVEIVPAYKSYKYFMLADGRIIIVDPNNMNIVAVIA
ncbi:DUF1236 domain-containing protein [Sinorhizobium fredii]|uniref:DUF1236 domain-containing protein n=1 Tax=Rhizobium fredii TaxID=380 RepID=UPI0009B6DABC|nr:DUF1236 domain-containing protein [Sinorhizobium fredii]